MNAPRLRQAVLASLLIALPSLQAAAGHLDPEQEAARPVFGIPVELMPPLHAEAYIIAIKEQLAAHGYDPGPPDGALSLRARAAIQAYQRDAGLPVDGVATKELLDHLMFVLPKVYAARAFPGEGAVFEQPSVLYEPPHEPLPPAPRSGRAYLPDEVLSEPLPDLPPAAPPASEAPPAAHGVVSQVQAELKRIGTYAGPVSGQYGPATAEAVRRYQAEAGLQVTGVIDAELLRALTDSTAPQSTWASPYTDEDARP